MFYGGRTELCFENFQCAGKGIRFAARLGPFIGNALSTPIATADYHFAFYFLGRDDFQFVVLDPLLIEFRGNFILQFLAALYLCKGIQTRK
jgi:hypothetical protein